MSKHRRWIEIAIVTLALAVPSFGQTYDFSPLDRVLNRAASGLPTGMEVLIVENDQEIYRRQFGGRQKDEQTMIASATKWLSGAVIMSLADDGILSLDDPASKYLPYMSGDKSGITIRQLMSHTAGFAGEFPVVHPCLGEPAGTLDDCARALAAAPLQARPGTAFIYSGADMQIAGRAAEVASGKDWQTLFRERIAAPLGMTSTDYEYRGATRNPRISGGGRSTASDYMKFLTMIHQRGIFEGRRILSTRAIDAMLADQTEGAPIVESPRQDESRYGIGVWLEEPWVSSSPGVTGFTPLMDRRRNLLVVISMQNVLRPFQPYYAEFKRVVQDIIPPAGLTPAGVTNGASFEAGPVSPGALLALFGRDLGPVQPAVAQLANGQGPIELEGTRVTFDGVPGRLLSASAGQVMTIAPESVAGKTSVRVQVSFGETLSPSVILPVAAAWPALFAAAATGRGQGAILNEDGGLNHTANPARRGSVLQLFGAGAGCIEAGMLPVSVSIGGQFAAVSYVGQAPALAYGVFQINAAVPAGISPGAAVPVVVQIGGYSSPGSITAAIQ